MNAITSTTAAKKNVKKRNVARVLFQHQMVEPDGSREISTGHQRLSYGRQ